MSRPLRIATFAGVFPSVSETFILRQITGQIDLGNEVDVYSDSRGAQGTPVHAEIEKYRLLERTTYVDAPPESVPWEMPIRPITGRTWLPGADRSIRNIIRFARALPKLIWCLVKAPRMTIHVLDRSEYPAQAESLSGLYRLSRLLARQKQYDIAHAHFGPVGNSFRFVRQLWRVPLIVSFHGYDVSSFPRAQGANVYEKLFPVADCVLTNSNYMSAKLKELGCPDEKIHKLNYGVDLDKFPFRPRSGPGDPVRIVTVARLVEKKGIDYVLRALSEIIHAVPRLNYDVIGDGPQRAHLEKLAATLDLQNVVRFHGALAGEGVRELCERAHIFVLASVTAENGDEEGTPVSLLEAQALGLPVISTLHAGIPEIVVDGESGFLVPERDVAALAERLKRLLMHPALWPTMGRHGRTNMENHFDSAKCDKNMDRIYRQLLSSPKRRG